MPTRQLRSSYKPLSWVLLLHLFSSEINAQVAPLSVFNAGGATYTQPIHPIPLPYASSGVNSIIEWDVNKPGMAETEIVNPSTNIQDVKQTTQYIDGLGRPVQTVQKGITPSGNDMVAPMVYDQFGREADKYLPYPSQNNDGGFKTDPFNEQAQYYNNTANGERFFYTHTNYEPSPLNRPIETFAPGNSWVGSNNGVSAQYLINTAADNVVIWTVGFTVGNVPVKTAFYAAGTLYKSITTDEANHSVVEYKDMQGKVILKKVQIADAPAADYSGWMCTYYIYDDLGNLRFVIQPQGTDWLRQHSWTFDNTAWSTSVIAQQQCFSYEYDARKRMTIKRIPAAGEVYMVYDARDRLVMTQDANLRTTNQWLYTNYDGLNRPTVTGIINSTAGDFASKQSAAGNSITYPSSAGSEILTQTFYDDYLKVPSASGLSKTLATRNINNPTYFLTPTNASFPYPQPILANYQVNNSVVCTATEIIGTSPVLYLYTVNFYDDRNRLLQTVSTNYSGDIDTVTNQYSFSGQVFRNYVAHGKGGTNPQTCRLLTAMTYDNAGRLLTTTKTTGKSPAVIISQNQYNELGQLVTKKLGQTRNPSSQNTYTSTPIDAVNYTYNIRGWVNGINPEFTGDPDNNDNWFGEILSYDAGFNQNQLNGNIAGVIWKNKSDDVQRAYGCTYDNANRLLQADFTEYHGALNWNTSAGIDFTTSNLSYDLNGNIHTMKQMGLKVNASSLIDNLTYNYFSNSNQTNFVTDAANDVTSTLGDFNEIHNTSTQDYTYDGNGNLTVDNNKNIKGILYNYLNLPKSVTVTGKGTIYYTYDAAGNKLRKVTGDSTVSPAKFTTTDYIGGFVYQNDVLQYIGQEEGRICAATLGSGTTDTMIYDYFEKDHLGDTRVVLTDKLQKDIYPAATLEGTAGTGTSAVDYESQFYNVNTGNIVNKAAATGITDYPDNNGINNPNPNLADQANSSRKLYKLNATGGTAQTGLGITLKVMAGDVIDIFGKSYYFQNNTSGNNYNLPLTDLLTGFLGGATGSIATKGATLTAITAGSYPTTLPTSFLNRTPAPGDQTPNAYINYIFFDEQFHYAGSGFSKVGSNSVVKDHHSELQNITVPKSGYVYVFVSNQSPTDVFLDNLQVVQTRGPLLETDNYYAFGLKQAGICDNAAGEMNEKHLYNGIEYDSSFGVDDYEARYRNLDDQIGRWWQIDPDVENGQESVSPYETMSDDPEFYSDPLGNTPGLWDELKKAVTETANQLQLPALYDNIVQGARAFNTYINPATPFVELATGKSVESDFTQDKSRATSTGEAMITLLPGAKIEGSATKALISLDNNALVNAIENGGKDAIKKSIGSDKPIISITAAKEFLVKGDKTALKDFMKETGATISKNGASASQVSALQTTAQAMGRSLSKTDASIIGNAINNGAKILTNDRRMGNFAKAVGVPIVNFPQ